MTIVPEETDFVRIESNNSERRSRRRFQIERPIAIQRLDLRGRQITGETVNISSQGILFLTSAAIPAGTRLRILLTWPIPSDRHVELVLCATVVRCEENLIAARIWAHQFQPSLAQEG
jgi:PilZ domain